VGDPKFIKLFVCKFISRGIHQSAVINNHPDCSGVVNRILNISVPNPFFLIPRKRKKKMVWLRKTKLTSAGVCHHLLPVHLLNQPSINLALDW